MSVAAVKSIINSDKQDFPNASISEHQYKSPDGNIFVGYMNVSTDSDPSNNDLNTHQALFIQFSSDMTGNTVVAVNRQVQYPSSISGISDAPTFQAMMKDAMSTFGYPQGYYAQNIGWLGMNPSNMPADAVFINSGCIVGSINSLPGNLYSGTKGCPETLEMYPAMNAQYGAHLQFFSEILLDSGAIYDDIERQNEVAAKNQAIQELTATQSPVARPSL